MDSSLAKDMCMCLHKLQSSYHEIGSHYSMTENLVMILKLQLTNQHTIRSSMVD